MNVERTSEFFNLIYDVAKQHITGNYILLGVPRHMNLGDSLIWQAENDILKKLAVKNMGTYFFNADLSQIKISNKDVVVFSGGGSWGDVWDSIGYIERVISTFKHNKIFFMPNSIWYNKLDRIDITIRAIEEHKNEIVLCNREKQSYTLANKYFPMINNYLLPDVVLSWDIQTFLNEKQCLNPRGNGVLYISRNDREKIQTKTTFDYDILSDWPTIVKTPDYIVNTMTNKEWEKNILPKLIVDSINFITPYKTVYSDRMHGAILSWLLNKDTFLINNSYGKSKSLYDTWLYNDENIKIIY